MNECELCTKTRPASQYVCNDCIKAAFTNLRNIRDFTHWADDKRARLGSVWSIGGGSRATETQLPYDPRVSSAVLPTVDHLKHWAAIVWDQAPNISNPKTLEPHNVALWLMDYVKWFASTQHAPVAFAQWQRDADALAALYDRPPEKVYLGACKAEAEDGPCTQSLYKDVTSTAAEVHCPKCGKATVVAERREELADNVEGYLGTARELSRLLRLVLGEDATPKVLWAYAKHGLIQQHGTRTEYDTLGRGRQVPLYQIGQVREAARIVDQDVEQRKAVRRIMRGIVAL